jgi:hypothetical protein
MDKNSRIPAEKTCEIFDEITEKHPLAQLLRQTYQQRMLS